MEIIGSDPMIEFLAVKGSVCLLQASGRIHDIQVGGKPSHPEFRLEAVFRPDAPIYHIP